LGLKPAKEIKPQELRRDPGGRVVSLPSSDDGVGRGVGQRPSCVPCDGYSSVDLLPVERSGGTVWPGDAPASRATTAADAQCDTPSHRAAGGGVLARQSGRRSGSRFGGARSAEVGWPQALSEPAFAQYLVPGYQGLQRDLERYLIYYNTDRAHTGRWTRGRTPIQVIGANEMFSGR